MGTDATALIELAHDDPAWRSPWPWPAWRSPWPWTEVQLRRDYVLFHLFGGDRSGAPGDAAVAVTRLRTPDGREDPESLVLGVEALEQVARAYRARQGRDSVDLAAVRAAMETLAQGDTTRVRLIVRFC